LPINPDEPHYESFLPQPEQRLACAAQQQSAPVWFIVLSLASAFALSADLGAGLSVDLRPASPLASVPAFTVSLLPACSFGFGALICL